jgi:hypothetical protein
MRKNNCLFGFGGGDRLKFGDVIMAVASMTLVELLVGTVLNLALVPISSVTGVDVAAVVSFLIAGLVVGYVFAGKIREESRMASIVKIAVLFAVLIMLIAGSVVAATGHYSDMVDDTLRSMYSTDSWTNGDWFAYEHMALFELTAVLVLLGLAFGFIGLYLGSMRKP